MSAPHEFRHSIENSLAEIDRLHTILEDVQQACGLSDGIVFALTIALDEVLTNIISYGYADEARHTINLFILVDDTAAVVKVSDDGVPFNPLEKEEPDIDAPLEERKIGGLGIHLVRNFMDDLSYERRDGRNILTLTKNLGGDAGS